MNETHVTLTGWLGGEVSTREAGGSSVASFRLACTPRRLNRRTGEWYDAETQWYTVNAWRTLGLHCADSLRRGDPVVVHGRLGAQTWTNADGVASTTMEVDAVFVGHDLNRGTSRFARSARTTSAEATAPGEADEGATTSGTTSGTASGTAPVAGAAAAGAEPVGAQAA